MSASRALVIGARGMPRTDLCAMRSAAADQVVAAVFGRARSHKPDRR